MIILILGAAFVFAATLVLLFLPGIFLRFLIWLVRRVLYRLRVDGLKNIPPSGGVVLICNHVSYADWLIVAAAVNRPVRFVADHAFFKNWFLRQILVRSHVIPIAGGREDPSRTGQAYERIAAELRQGEVVCIFPEGQITYTGKIGAFKPGVIKIIKKTPVPVVPMCLHGLWGSVFSREGGRAMSRLPRRFRAPVELRIGKPIPPAEVLIARLEEGVKSLSAPRET